MSELVVYSMGKASVGKVPVPKGLEGKVNKGLLYQVTVAQQTNRRHGTSKVKNRHEVSGSTRKIYRQKGTGNARHGDIKAPLFVGGGRAFGPKPRDYEVVLPQKIRSAALREAVALRRAEGRLWVIDSLDFKAPKTKDAARLFEKFEIPGALVVLDAANANTEKSIRNLAGFKVSRVEAMTVLDVLRFRHLVVTRKAYDRLAERWNGAAK
jgi:large subunit ribosomal protein L4